MAYEAKREGSFNSDDKQAQEARANANNAKNIRNAADVAIASKNPYAMAAGAAVKAADKITGGKSTEALGKGMTKANKITPGGNRVQNASNKLSESGASDKIGKAAAMKNQMGGGKGGGATGAKAPEKAPSGGSGSDLASTLPDKDTNNLREQNIRDAQAKKGGGEQSSSLPSSSDSKNKPSIIQDETSEEESSAGGLFGGKGLSKFLAKQAVVTVVLFVAPFILIILLFFVAIASVTGLFSEYQDAFGMGEAIGDETGGLYVEEGTEDQQKFYERVKQVKDEYQQNGKTVDAMKIISIFHVLKEEGADFDYKDISTATIKKWADAMFNGNTYDSNTFKKNLANSIIPEYLPNLTQKQREELAQEVLDYINRYYDLIGKEPEKETSSTTGNSCSTMGSCDYDIKGFYISGKGNVVKNLQISNLKVRLMECGQPYGNGNPTTPIDQDLVDFEEYAAGVAYAEVGASSDIEVLKAQMVAARSYALARPTVMSISSGKKLEQENGQWILQISSCVADQLFCNINMGCSFMGQSNGGHSGICRSGIISGAKSTRQPLPADHKLRQAAAETQGEVLVNDQGYIIYTPYINTDQHQWMDLAKQGMNYKQILLQHYNQGKRNLGATDIKKMDCGSSGSSCTSSGEFSTWKQTDPAWGSIPMGDSGKNIHQIGCLATAVAILIAKSGVAVDSSINPLNPGTFVEFMNAHGGFAAGGNFVWAVATKAAPDFKYQGRESVAGMSKEEKLNKIKEIVNTPGAYAVAEVMGETGQHWVAIDNVNGDTIYMMDPGSEATEMWTEYQWNNTSMIGWYKVG